MHTATYSCIFIMLLFSLAEGQAQRAPDYLILQDIGNYKFKTQSKDFITGQPRNIPGYSSRITPGFLASADHFDADHDDETYETKYINKTVEVVVEVQVTQHSGDESDKWLLHELDIELRNYYGTPGHYLKAVDGNTIYVYGAGGRNYRWLSGNKVIVIDYHDSQLTKPEPIEIVQAYLAKHPSTLPAITMKELYSSGKKIAWIKDEMDRRLWLCDKWFKELQFKRAEEKDVYREAVKSMIVFINYREKYYGIKAEDDKNLLENYLYENNGTGIKAKLTEYKNWWGVNKSKSISL